ncbi:unnamed protein product [Triticum turgidum subsp. durum]|uniref:Uncharacterized protein n=1 Tax=Triticum turgidum subsp. durum TaxID=4567 RepID=A0A9R1QWA3_TRITD|nr:unnamed protein product [Triticum turgidum subsp. durum]
MRAFTRKPPPQESCVRGQDDHAARSPVLAILITVLALEFSIRTKIWCSEGASISEGIYQWWVQYNIYCYVICNQRRYMFMPFS